MSLGQMIRKKREQLNLTLNEVSNRVGLSKPYLSTIETGKVKNPPSDQLLKKLEKTLNFEPGLLLHIAHLENLPSDIRYEFESAKAENQKMRQFIKKIVHEKTDPSQFDTLLAETELDAERGDGEHLGAQKFCEFHKLGIHIANLGKILFVDYHINMGVLLDFMKDVQAPPAAISLQYILGIGNLLQFF